MPPEQMAGRSGRATITMDIEQNPAVDSLFFEKYLLSMSVTLDGEKFKDIVAEGAILHDSIASCVCACDVVVTMVGFPDDVREVYMDEGGILAHAREGQLLIDMTTSSPKLAQELAQLAGRRACGCSMRR
mgnify:CR=1 FL=1